MKILITGAAGGIGSSLYKNLINDYNLVLVDNLRNGYIENIASEIIDKFHQIDINSKEFDILFEKERPDIVIHLAAITSLPDCESNVNECFRVNVEGTSSILNCCKKYGVKKLIFSSTSAVYENSINISGFTEDEEINPTLFYSLSKKMSEDICTSYRKNYGIDLVIFRFFNVFGPNQDIYRKNPPLINYIVKEFCNKNKPILHSNGNQCRDYIYIEDVIKAIKQSFTQKFNDDYIFNLCSGKTISVSEIVDAIKESNDDFKKLEVEFRSSDMLWDKYDNLFEGNFKLSKNIVSKETNKFSLGSTSIFEKEFGWKPSTEVKNHIKNTAIEIKNKISNIKI